MKHRSLKIVAAVVIAATLAITPAGSVFVPQETATVQAAAFKINKKNLTLKAGQSKTLKIKNAGGYFVKWSSKDESVAKVSASGVVTPVGNGTTKIIAKVNGSKFTCKVKVSGMSSSNNNNNNNNVSVRKPSISYSEVDRQAQVGQDLVNEQLVQAVITFDGGVPSTAAQLKSIDRSDGSGNSQNRRQDGKYLTVALALCALRAYTETSPAECTAMLNALMVSPHVSATSVGSASNVNYYLSDSYKAQRIPWAFFDGASASNGYSPSSPLSVTIEEYPYAPQLSTFYGAELQIDAVQFNTSNHSTLKNNTKIQVYKDPSDGQWYLWPSGFAGILSTASIN